MAIAIGIGCLGGVGKAEVGENEILRRHVVPELVFGYYIR